MEVLHTTEVTPDQIDHLGHMNVEHYAANARIGATALLATLGAGAPTGPIAGQREIYVRHHHEQLVGARLAVRGGVLDVSDQRIRLYEELVNADTDDVAATFVLTFAPTDREARDASAFADAFVERAAAATVELPERGRPRSITLDDDPAESAPDVTLLTGRNLAIRQVRTIAQSECDPAGDVLPLALNSLLWGGEDLTGRGDQPFEPLAGGGRLAFATMETRATWVRPARVGDRIQSFGADLETGSKTLLSRYWLVDVDRSEVIGVLSILSLAFDLDSRRSVVIPDRVREAMGRRIQADLG